MREGGGEGMKGEVVREEVVRREGVRGYTICT